MLVQILKNAKKDFVLLRKKLYLFLLCEKMLYRFFRLFRYTSMEICMLFWLTFHLVLWVYFRNLKISVRKIHSKVLSKIEKNEQLLHAINLSVERMLEAQSHPFRGRLAELPVDSRQGAWTFPLAVGGSSSFQKGDPQHLTKTRSLPFPLMNVPFADEAGIILSIKNVAIPFIPAPGNASIGTNENGYLLFFRYDSPKCSQFVSNIGCISLDSNFEPSENECSRIETNSSFSEDARFFKHGEDYFLVYNDLISRSGNQRGIRIGAIDLLKRKLEYVTPLHLDSTKVEKNWTPFSHQGQIHFMYTIHPQKIVTLPNPRKNLLQSSFSPLQPSLNWPSQWGLLRGGTPAQLVDGEYLAFFHSSFEDHRGVIWYTMGAYTFAPCSPFKITRISAHPILFKGIYDTPHQIIANPKTRSIYPAGFVYEYREGKELIHLSCGENDSGIKIVSIDKNALLASLKTLSD